MPIDGVRVPNKGSGTLQGREIHEIRELFKKKEEYTVAKMIAVSIIQGMLASSMALGAIISSNSLITAVSSNSGGGTLFLGSTMILSGMAITLFQGSARALGEEKTEEAPTPTEPTLLQT